MKKTWTRDELLGEIERVRLALAKTESEKLRTDYTKYSRKLEKELRRRDRYVPSQA